MVVLKLELPLPASKNRLHRLVKIAGHATMTNTAEYRAYKQAVWAAVMEQTTPEQRTFGNGVLCMQVEIRFPANRRRRDLINAVDALADAVAPALGVDDSRIWHLQLDRHEHPDLPECTVRVWEIAHCGAATATRST